MKHLENLNDQQINAATHTNGAALILAGAGTGKTAVISARIANLIFTKVATSDQIMAVTFTNKAANEMKMRIRKVIDAELIWIGTFHSIGAKILRLYHKEAGLPINFTIADENDRLSVIKQTITDLNIIDKKVDPKYIINTISTLKSKGINYNDHQMIPHIHDIDIQKIYETYQNHLLSYDMLDFDDLILLTTNLIYHNQDVLHALQDKIKYIMVDEYQDTSSNQYRLIGKLSSSNRNIFCVGDEDQSIYSWRGAEIGNIIGFKNHFQNATIINLEQNYRSSNNILAVANALISSNKSRYGKILRSTLKNNDPVKIITYRDNYDEADNIAIMIKNSTHGTSYNNTAILVRTSSQIPQIEESMIRYNLPYKIIDGIKFYDRKEIKDILAYLKLSYCNKDAISFARIVNMPKRGIGNKTIETIKEYASKYDGNLINAIEKLSENHELGSKASLAGLAFASLMKSISREINEDDSDVSHILSFIAKASGYMESLQNDIELGDQQAQNRIDNINELISTSRSNSIQELLERIALMNSSDNISNESVNIMTIHAAKGLEFDTVILPGWEESIFPNYRVINETGDSGLEEERRIGYVAITRAKKSAIISWVTKRLMYGKWSHQIKSRFIDEILKNTNQNSVIELQHNHNIKEYDNVSRNLNHTTNIPSHHNNRISKHITDHYNRDLGCKGDANIAIGIKVSHNRFGYGVTTGVFGQFIEVKFDDGSKHLIQKNFLSIK